LHGTVPQSRWYTGGQVDGADHLAQIVVDEGRRGLLPDPDASSEPAVDAVHDLVLGRRARKAGGAMVDGDRREPPGPGASRAAAVHLLAKWRLGELG
jgi:hypothetical protein